MYNAFEFVHRTRTATTSTWSLPSECPASQKTKKPETTLKAKRPGIEIRATVTESDFIVFNAFIPITVIIHVMFQNIYI